MATTSWQTAANGPLEYENGRSRDQRFSGGLAWNVEFRSDQGVAQTLRRTLGTSSTSGMNALLSRGTSEPHRAPCSSLAATTRRPDAIAWLSTRSLPAPSSDTRPHQQDQLVSQPPGVVSAGVASNPATGDTRGAGSNERSHRDVVFCVCSLLRPPAAVLPSCAA